MIGLNRGAVSDPAAPFGGMKQSGLGREGGRERSMPMADFDDSSNSAELESIDGEDQIAWRDGTRHVARPNGRLTSSFVEGSVNRL